MELKDKPDNIFEVEEVFYLLVLNQATYEESSVETSSATPSVGGGTTSAGSVTAAGSTAAVGPSGGQSASGNAAAGSSNLIGPSPGSSSSTAIQQPDPNTDVAKSDVETNGSQTPKLFYTIKSLVQFDTFAVTHGPYTRVDGIC